MVGILILGGVAYVAPKVMAQFPVERIQVGGDFQYVPRAELEKKLTQYLHQSFFTLDLRKLKQDAEKIPWVESAKVHRTWPGIVEVEISERVAIAVWNDSHLISHRGELFKPADIATHQHLPNLYGDEDLALEVMSRYQEVTQLMRRLELEVVRLELAPRMSWSIRLNNGIELFVDRRQSINKLMKFADLYGQLRDLEPKVAKVDLRYRNGMAVTWREEG